MQKDTDQNAPATDDGDAIRSKGLIIDLEHVALDGHAAFFETLQKILKTKDVDLTMAQFARFCVSRRSADFVPELLSALGRKQLSADKLVADITRDYAKSLSKDQAAMVVGLDKLLEAAKGEGFALGAVSSLPEEDAKVVFDSLGLESMDVTLLTGRDSGEVSVDGETWRQMATVLNVPVAACVGVTADAAGARTVLGAGMNVAVKPAAVTSFQDFSGADVVVDDLDAASIASILRIVGHD